MRPSVLIMMSTYNGEKYVSEQIESILAQQHVDITLAIRDDGSNDTTLHILTDYAAKHQNISVTAGDNIGYAASFWTLLMQADTSYDYYAFADQDDLWDANKIAAAIFAIKKTDNPLTLYTSALRVVDENLNEQYINTFPRLKPTLGSAITRPRLSGCTMVFSNSLLRLCQTIDIRKADGRCLAHDVAVYLSTLACGGKVIFSKRSYIRLRRHAKTVTGHGKSVFKRAATVLDVFFTRRKEATKQAQFLLTHYDEQLTDESRAILDAILAYPTSFKKTIALCFDHRIKCRLRSVDIVNIFAILFHCY